VSKSLFDKQKRVPRYLAPKIKKRHAAVIYQAVEDQWRLFAEGCLRNRFFHERVFGRGSKCLACDRRFNRKDAAVHSKIQKHHRCYSRICTGQLLSENSEDIYRPAVEGEIDAVPDCRQCSIENPEYFAGCLKRIYPVHGECHEDIHELERYFVKKKKWKLLEHFNSASLGNGKR